MMGDFVIKRNLVDSITLALPFFTPSTKFSHTKKPFTVKNKGWVVHNGGLESQKQEMWKYRYRR